MSGYDRMLRTLGGNLMEFIENLDALHSYLSLSYQEMNAPSFRVERADGMLLLHYYSDRKGLYHIVPGILEAVSRDFFDSEVTLKILHQDVEEERTGKKEHVVFFLSQNEKEAKNGVKEKIASAGGDCREDEKRLDAAFQKAREGPVLHQLEKKSHWDIVRHIVKFRREDLIRTLEPFFPERLWVEERTFCCAFPFHIVFDETLKIKQAGVNIQKFVPGLQIYGTRLDEYFSIVHPQVTFTIFSIRKFINSQFVLKIRRDALPKLWARRPMLKLRGQMIWMDSMQCMMYLCSPKLRSLEELEEQRMHLSDIAQHDTTRDLILFNQQRLAEIELSNQLERKKEELRILSKNLEAEKKKSEALLYAMLPKHVANQLKEGKKVEAGDFSCCTILFSDVVTFTNICSACEPIQIVNMLNSMYSRFDRLTSVHGVYKVETIGDAYMVVGGIPVPVSSHAERVANFALGMRIAAREVMNPLTDKPIQIRIGVHTGPVLAGVVGEKMPRYCLFGDTVNTASRMESHGLPDKIHLSPTTFRALSHQVFEMVERGEIQVKGKGKMTTHFLRKNLHATENEIMGRLKETSEDTLESHHGKNVVIMKYAEDSLTARDAEHREDATGAERNSQEKEEALLPNLTESETPSAFCVLF
nr:guanylate cyclase soluble subunit beta-2-like [Zootoca vivipara]